MFLVVDKSTQEDKLSQPLQTNDKQFKLAVGLVTGFNDVYNFTSQKRKISISFQ